MSVEERMEVKVEGGVEGKERERRRRRRTARELGGAVIGVEEWGQ